jgi:hypothetical protein
VSAMWLFYNAGFILVTLLSYPVSPPCDNAGLGNIEHDPVDSIIIQFPIATKAFPRL